MMFNGRKAVVALAGTQAQTGALFARNTTHGAPW